MTRLERNISALVIGILLGMWMGASWATGGHVVVVKPLVIAPVTTPIVAPPLVTQPVAPAAPVQPAQPVAGNGPGVMGWAVMAGVATFFWAVICVKEQADNPNGFWAKRMCLRVEPR